MSEWVVNIPTQSMPSAKKDWACMGFTVRYLKHPPTWIYRKHRHAFSIASQMASLNFLVEWPYWYVVSLSLFTRNVYNCIDYRFLMIPRDFWPCWALPTSSFYHSNEITLNSTSQWEIYSPIITEHQFQTLFNADSNTWNHISWCKCW